MGLVLLAVLGFGWVHPGGKLFLDSGIPLSYFCLLYVGLRFLVLLAIMLIRRRPPQIIKGQLLKLIGFGLIGASLQYFEFKGLAQGLSPALVTFLVFSNPIWLWLYQFSFPKNRRQMNPIQPICLLLGMFFICADQMAIDNPLDLVFPLLASLALALWVLFSNHLRKSKMQSSSLSLYYDGFSLLALLPMLGHQLILDFSIFSDWASPYHLAMLLFFSVAIGLIPNLLFYGGSRKLSPYVAGGLMAFEPVLATFYALTIWEDQLAKGFWIGAGLLLLGNIQFKKVFQLSQSKLRQVKAS